MTTAGAALIATERQRQIDVEGWTPEHDTVHDHNDELALAAAAYALPEDQRGCVTCPHSGPGPFVHLPPQWPWEERFWKPTPNDRVRELVKAGALIAAEIDRLQTREL